MILSSNISMVSHLYIHHYINHRSLSTFNHPNHLSSPSHLLAMFLRFAATYGLLAAGVSGASLPQPATGARVIDDRDDYWRHAKEHGMCNPKFGREDNLKRILAVPGDDILAPFAECVAKNEFGEKLQDTSGSIFCHGQVSDGSGFDESSLTRTRRST
jgi:hypothetical protein